MHDVNYECKFLNDSLYTFYSFTRQEKDCND